MNDKLDEVKDVVTEETVKVGDKFKDNETEAENKIHELKGRVKEKFDN